MDSEAAILDALLQGPLWSAPHSWPLTLAARLGDVQSRFIPKGTVGKAHRAIARNGRVLLASGAPLSELTANIVHLRLQTWHKAILPGDRPAPYGILVCVRTLEECEGTDAYRVNLAAGSGPPSDLELDVGGGLRLEFRRPAA